MDITKILYSYNNIPDHHCKVVELGYEPDEAEQDCLDKNLMAKILKGIETNIGISAHLAKN